MGLFAAVRGIPYPTALLFEDQERGVMRGILLVDPGAVQLEGERRVVGDHLVAAGDVVAGDVGDDPKMELLWPLLRRVPLRLTLQDLRRSILEPDGPSRVCRSEITSDNGGERGLHSSLDIQLTVIKEHHGVELVGIGWP